VIFKIETLLATCYWQLATGGLLLAACYWRLVDLYKNSVFLPNTTARSQLPAASCQVHIGISKALKIQ
jgi:hypothetical protein